MLGELKVEQIRHLTIPTAGTNVPGPIYSLVSDSLGDIYFTDEFSHAVISVDREGKKRWVRTENDAKAGRFKYPRGIALGHTRTKDVSTPCLAICDSWNDSIQLLDLNGALIDVWNSAGKLAFREPSDVRFISGGEVDPASLGYWLVLDRGNHRLCYLNTEGELIAQIGRCLPPLFEAAWADMLLQLSKRGRSNGVCRPGLFDPLFYGERILGQSEEALFVAERASSRLKQIIQGNLYTISISAPGNGMWTGAGVDGFISWSRPTGMLSFHDKRGLPAGEIQLPGIPVVSDSSLGRLWMQQGTELSCFECLVDTMKSPVRKREDLWSRSYLMAEREIDTLLGASGPVLSTVRDLRTMVDGIISEAYRSIEWLRGNTSENEDCRPLSRTIEEIESGMMSAHTAWIKAIQQVSPPLLRILSLDQTAGGRGSGVYFAGANRNIQEYLAEVKDGWATPQALQDDILLVRWILQPESLEGRAPAEPTRLIKLGECLETLMIELDTANEVLSSILDVLAGPEGPHSHASKDASHLQPLKYCRTPSHFAQTSGGELLAAAETKEVPHLDKEGQFGNSLSGWNTGDLQSPIHADEVDNVLDLLKDAAVVKHSDPALVTSLKLRITNQLLDQGNQVAAEECLQSVDFSDMDASALMLLADANIRARRFADGRRILDLVTAMTAKQRLKTAEALLQLGALRLFAGQTSRARAVFAGITESVWRLFGGQASARAASAGISRAEISRRLQSLVIYRLISGDSEATEKEASDSARPNDAADLCLAKALWLHCEWRNEDLCTFLADCEQYHCQAPIFAITKIGILIRMAELEQASLLAENILSRKLSPCDQIDAWTLRGSASLAANRLDEGKEFLLQACDLIKGTFVTANDFWITYFELTMLHWYSGDVNAAFNTANQSLAVHPAEANPTAILLDVMQLQKANKPPTPEHARRWLSIASESMFPWHYGKAWGYVQSALAFHDTGFSDRAIEIMRGILGSCVSLRPDRREIFKLIDSQDLENRELFAGQLSEAFFPFLPVNTYYRNLVRKSVSLVRSDGCATNTSSPISQDRCW